MEKKFVVFLLVVVAAGAGYFFGHQRTFGGSGIADAQHSAAQLPPKPDKKTLEEMINKSANQAVLAGQQNITEIRDSYYEPYATPELGEKNLVSRRDSDGVDQLIWAVDIDRIAHLKILVSQGGLDPRPLDCHVIYRLFFRKVGDNNWQYELGHITINQI